MDNELVGDLVLAESSRELALVASAWPEGTPLVSLDHDTWQVDVRSHLGVMSAALVTDSLNRSGTIVAALRMLTGIRSLTWYVLPRMVRPEDLTKVERALRALHLFHASVDVATIRGEACAAVTFDLERTPTVVHHMASLVASAQLMTAPLPPTGRGCVVASIGADAQRWFANWARVVDLDNWSDPPVGALAEGAVDLMLVSDGPNVVSEDAIGRAIALAKDSAVPVVGLSTERIQPTWMSQVDMRLDMTSPQSNAKGVLPFAPLRTLLPRRIAQPVDGNRWLAMPTVLPGQIGWGDVVECLEKMSSEVGVDLLLAEGASNPGRLPPNVAVREGHTSAPEHSVEAADGYAGVLEHPAFHTTAVGCPERLACLGVAGIPVAIDAELALDTRLFGPRVVDVLRSARIEHLSAVDARELYAVRLRRAILRDHSQETRWRQFAAALGFPVRRAAAVSVVVATNRPSFLVHLGNQIAHQDYQEVEVVVGLHGAAFDRRSVDEFKERIPFPTTVLSLPDSHRLGDVLNSASDMAAGDVITKFDDDDWYGPPHIVDLVLAAEASGAQLVGKAAEFLYLADLDVTIRRFTSGQGLPSRVLAGGCLCIRKADLRVVGGWRRVGRAVDQRLIDDVLSAGGRTYRTHGFGYILNRHGLGHTWDADVDYFLSQSRSQYRGLRLDIADAEQGTVPGVHDTAGTNGEVILRDRPRPHGK